MKFTALQIAALLGGTVDGDPNVEVWNVAKIEEGAQGMLSFLANPKYIPYIYETKSSVVIVNRDFVAEKPVAATLIRVDDAYASFAKLLAYYDQMSQDKKGVSSLAFVSSTAKCGDNIYLGEFAFLGENAEILFFGFCLPGPVRIQRADRQQNMRVRIVAVRVVDRHIRAHALGCKLCLDKSGEQSKPFFFVQFHRQCDNELSGQAAVLRFLCGLHRVPERFPVRPL